MPLKKGTVNEVTRYIQEWIAEHHQMIEHYFRSKEFTDTLQKTLPQVFSVLGQTASIVIKHCCIVYHLLYMFFILLDYEYLTENWIKIFSKEVQ